MEELQPRGREVAGNDNIPGRASGAALGQRSVFLAVNGLRVLSKALPNP